MGLIRIPALCSMLALLYCNSLLSELERIRKKQEAADAESAFLNSPQPQVIATDPADGAVGPYTQTTVSLTFSAPVDAATLTYQTTSGPCSGNIRLSWDGGNNCLGGTLDSSANPHIVLQPQILPKALPLRLYVLEGVTNTLGKPAEPYSSPLGFRFAAPCGVENCFFSYSAPLPFNVTGVRSGVFRILGGTHAGKFLVYTEGQGNTALVDPQTWTVGLGPAISPTCAMPGGGTTDVLNTAGTKQIIIIGGNPSPTCFFDHATNTFSIGPSMPAGVVGIGAHTIKPSGDEAGNILVIQGGSTPAIARISATDTTSTTSYSLATGNAYAGAHSVFVRQGAYANKWLVFYTHTQNSVYTESPAGISAGYTMPNVVGYGAASFEIFSGVRAGQLLTIFGGNQTAVYAYDLVNGSPAPAHAALPVSVNNGGLLLREGDTASFDAPLLIHSNGLNPYYTSRYNPTTGAFEPGPVTTGPVNNGSAAIYGQQNGVDYFFIVNGQSSFGSTSMYFPGTNTFSGTRMPLSVPNNGGHAVRIGSGVINYWTLVIGGGNRHTALYNPITHNMLAGPQTLSPVTGSGFSFALTRGNHSGKVFVFHGGAATFEVFDPTLVAFVSSTSLSSPAISGSFATMGAGATAFPLHNDDRFLILHGGGSNTTRYFNQVTGEILATSPTLPCAMQNGKNVLFVRPSDNLVRQLILCDNSQFIVFDHPSALPSSFHGPFALSSTTGPGAQLFRIAAGPQAGNVLLVLGGGSSSTIVFDAETLAQSVGPAIGGGSNCGPGVNVNNGSQVLNLSYGPYAGGALLLTGGASQDTCIYNPATHNFIPGPKVGAGNNGPGFAISASSVAFATGGGLYPTAFVVASGAQKNVWSTYVP